MIVAVGELDETLAATVVDITGRAISPGFIMFTLMMTMPY